METKRTRKDLLQHMKNNKPLLIAEGYVWEFLRRGRVRGGSLVPEVVLDHPEAVRALHQEFVDAGSDVVQAFTYYAHRQKMRDVGREDELEVINCNALKIAKAVAQENDRFFAGGLCNSNIWDPEDPATILECEQMFSDQCQWAKDAEVDYMIAETFWDYGEASLALKVLKRFGLTSVISICPLDYNGEVTFDKVPIPEALRRLEEEGADVVTLNCGRGPKTMLPLIKKCQAVCKGPIGCLPICYRTNDEKPNFQSLTYIGTDRSCYPHDLREHYVSLEEVQQFASSCKELGLNYIGLCCGNDPAYMRTMAKFFNRPTALDKYDADRTKNAIIGDHTVKKSGETEKKNRYADISNFAQN